MPHELIADAAQFRSLCSQWQQQKLLYLDTEFERIRTFWPKLALLQVSDGSDIWLIDPLANIPLDAFAPLLADPGIVKVMHSASEDLLVLQRAFGAVPKALMDTQIGATLAGLGAGMGYQRIVNELLNVELSKEETRTDWMQRPLSDAQREYAAADVAHLPALYRLIMTRAEELQRGAWIIDDCQRLIDKVQREILEDAEPLARFRNAWKLPPGSQVRLHRLLEWREHRARERDRPRTWILDNESCIALARVEQADTASLKSAVVDCPRGLPHRLLEELAALLSPAVTEQELSERTAPEPLSERQKRTLKALLQSVLEHAERMQIPADILCSRKQAEAWLRQQSWPRDLAGWREPVLRAGFEKITLASTQTLA